MFGRELGRGLGVAHFAGTLLFSIMTFGGLLVAGYSGQLRRLADPAAYPFLSHLATVNRHISFSAFLLGATQLLFVGNFFYSLWRGRRAADNPWEAPTLEWTVSSPPPPENFAAIPEVIRGPHEFDGAEALGQAAREGRSDG
jgi:cytochrome c oxidase subunit 1